MGNFLYSYNHINKINDEQINQTDEWNLKLVLKGFRPAYYWFLKSERIIPPSVIDGLKRYDDIVPNAYWYVKKDVEFIIPTTSKTFGIALGYLYQIEKNDEYFWVTFKLDKIHLWSEAMPKDCDFNHLKRRLIELKKFNNSINYNIFLL